VPACVPIGVEASPVLDDAIRSIAIVRARVGLGDLLCTIPALRALRAAKRRAHVTLVGFAETAPIVDRLAAYVDELLPLPGWPGIPERPVSQPALDTFVAEARARRFDLAIQMYGANPAANALLDAIGARRSVGFSMPGDHPRDPAAFLPYPHHLHEIDRHLQLLRLLGVSSTDRRLEFPITTADEREAARAGLDGRPFALLHPGATSPSRRWSLERWARVGDALTDRGVAVAITGVPGEEPLVEQVRDLMRKPSIDLCGRTSLGAFAAVVRDATLLVGNDSGPAHLAAAVGTPSVVVFLAGDPVRWAHGGRHRAVRADVGCNPCPHLSCPIDHRCAERVGVEKVLEAVDAALAGEEVPA
jgi:ADP-heptose:LPS heptosyltransferase